MNNSHKDGKKRFKLNTVIMIMIFLLIPIIFSKMPYVVLICCFAELYIVAVTGLDILFGYTGQVSMGHAAFFCIGAYGSALINEFLHVPVLISTIIAAIIASLIAAIIAYPAAKLKFHFLTLATIAFGEITYLIAAHSPGGITGDFKGFFTKSYSIFGFQIDTDVRFFYFAAIIVIIFLLIKQLLINSNTGRAFIAIRENTAAANGMGINVRKYKVMAFAISAFYTSFAGSMYAHLTRFINPETFFNKQSVMFMTMLLFGGTGSLWGPIMGVATVFLLTESLRSFQEYQMLMYGGLLLIVIILIPGGVFGSLKNLFSTLKNKMNNKNEGVQN